METKEQVKHTPYRILNSKEVWAERQMVAKAFTIDAAESIVHEHNCYGELLGALQRCATLMKNGFIPPENIGKDAEEIVSGDYANGWDAACEEFRNSRTAEIAQAAIAKAEGR